MPSYCKVCKENGEKTYAHYGYEGGKRTRCSLHQEPGMIYLNKLPMCKKCGEKQATYGFKGKSRTHCGCCKQPNMILIGRMCKKCGKKQANYGFKGKSKTHCASCREPEMIYIGGMCKTPHCETRASSKYDGYCFRCYCYHNPDAEIPRRYLTKEIYLYKCLKQFFTTYLPDLKLIHNKYIQGGQFRRRPDFLLDCTTHNIVIELDENQHNTKDYQCETKRQMQIFQDLGNLPLIMIRFNPDQYKIGKKKFKSCFTFTKDGSLKVDKKQWNKRYNMLLKILAFGIKSVPDREVTTVYLYYDDDEVRIV